MGDTENYDNLRRLSFDLGASLFGVARVASMRERFLSLPPPGIDNLSHAISLGVHLSDKILEGIEDGPTPLYFFHYQRVNILLDEMALRITFYIQNQGFDALPIPASQVIDWEGQRGHLSHKHVAKEAGLGWIGRNNLLINPQFGARVRLVSVLSDIPLRANDPMLRDCGTCRNCIPVCPAGAIVEESREFDHIACYETIKALCKERKIRHYICGICIKACAGMERP